jgi:hypothetical protein
MDKLEAQAYHGHVICRVPLPDGTTRFAVAAPTLAAAKAIIDTLLATPPSQRARPAS